jgi:hypothetical protein
VGGLRTAVVGSTLALGVWASVPQAAQAATTTPGPVSISFSGVAADGTHLVLTAHITDVTLSSFSPADPGASTGNPDLEFLDISMTTDESTGTGPSFNGFDAVPATAIQVSLPDGSTVPAQTPGPDLAFLLGTYTFVVPSSTTSGTLEVTPGTVSDLEYPGTVSEGNAAFSSVTFQPASAPVVVPPPPVSTTVPTVPATTQPVIHTAPPKKPADTTKKRVTTSGGLSTAATVGTAAGGGLVVVLLVIPIWRRRVYDKADKEGRVIIVSPPVPGAPPPIEGEPPDAGQPEAEAPAAGGPTVVVKVIGPVEVDGLVQSFGLKPEQELLVFLALHPGRRYTSIELRSLIWIEGRDEPSAGTFRNYLTAMRKCLPPGTVVRTGLTYALTETVTSDWARMTDALEDHDERAERLAEALELVRGSPFEGAFSGRNAPYGWAGDLSHQIEATVERAGHELATLGLDSGDLALADAGTARVLKCLPASIVARGDQLRLGSALGGPREVERRMRAARQALGDDVVLLEPLALSIGWVKV